MKWIRIGAVNGFLAVALGALAAHVIKDYFEAGKLEVFETAVRYHMIHALALLGVGGLSMHVPSRAVTSAGTLMMTGIILFSGSLYVLALTDQRFIGMITPIGGLCLLAGWVLVFIGAQQRRTPES